MSAEWLPLKIPYSKHHERNMKRIKNIISFFYPLMVEATNGDVTPFLEIIQYKGKYHLNSMNANYSFGSLHTIFDRLFAQMPIGQYQFENILILGMGGGSIVSLLRNKYSIATPITAVEKDPVVIELAAKYFDIAQYKDLSIVQADAYDFVCTSADSYDLVIIDLFVDAIVPEIFASPEFLTHLRRVTSDTSCIIYNKMTEHPAHKQEFDSLSEEFGRLFPGSRVIKVVANHSENSLLYCNTAIIRETHHKDVSCENPDYLSPQLSGNVA